MPKKLTIEEMQEIAKSRGGKCLSKNYINSKTNLKWQCRGGHVWEAAPDSVKHGTWCLICAGKALGTIEEMQKLAESRGGKCLSKKYVRSTTKLEWECAKGHVWKAQPSNVKHRDSWCPKCASKRSARKRRNSIEYMQELAGKKGGKCLSTKYINNKTKIKWQCREGHVWEAKSNDIVSDQWCPVCSSGLTERICRGIFEEIFEEKFTKSKPKWLLNNENNRMELDGYNKKLGLAFEYHGVQHFRYKKHFHRSNNTLEKRISDDKSKRDLCQKNKVVLIEIPFKVEHNDLFDYIIKEIKEKDIPFPDEVKKIDYKKLNIFSPEPLKELQKIAKSKGGRCLSKNYVSARSKLRWQCIEGHEWEAIPYHITCRGWCPECANKSTGDRLRGNIEEMQEIAKSRGGKCLSKKYVDSYTKLKWQCAEGHIWQSNPVNVKNSEAWCPKCAIKKNAENQRSTIEDMQKLASKKGGKCLSSDYINRKTNLKWQCTKGHIWETPPGYVVDGNWCPRCAGNIKKTIDDMKKLAERKSGKCLSTEYINNRTKLKWQCKDGHVWETTPHAIKRGRWCPTCYRNSWKKN